MAPSSLHGFGVSGYAKVAACSAKRCAIGTVDAEAVLWRRRQHSRRQLGGAMTSTPTSQKDVDAGWRRQTLSRAWANQARRRRDRARKKAIKRAKRILFAFDRPRAWAGAPSLRPTGARTITTMSRAHPLGHLHRPRERGLPCRRCRHRRCHLRCQCQCHHSCQQRRLLVHPSCHRCLVYPSRHFVRRCQCHRRTPWASSLCSRSQQCRAELRQGQGPGKGRRRGR